jgi:hypothetical protein
VKRTEIKRRPLADTTLAGLEPENATYREQDGNGLYFRVKANGQKSWELRYKKPDGKWSWLGHHIVETRKPQTAGSGAFLWVLTCPE